MLTFYFESKITNNIKVKTQSLFYSAAPQFGQRIRVTRMQRPQVILVVILVVIVVVAVVVILVVTLVVISVILMVVAW